jgi:TrmH family RNA methyltransferase
MRDLRRRKARDRHTRCVVEGVRAVEELLASPVALVGALVRDDLDTSPRGAALLAALDARGVRTEAVSERDFASAAETDAPQGVLVAAEIPERTLADLPRTGTILVLDGLQDPGNVGTILRTAAALGAAATVALPGTVDLWNAKVIRSAVGAHFRHLAFHASAEALLDHLRDHGIPLWGAVLGGTPVAEVQRVGHLALAVGNEGAGISALLSQRLDARVTIPITSGAESLNVAVATGILLHHLCTR